MDAHRTRRSTAVYDAEPATARDLTDILAIIDKLLPAIHAILLRDLANARIDLPSPGQRPS